jgi:hypothetical protein
MIYDFTPLDNLYLFECKPASVENLAAVVEHIIHAEHALIRTKYRMNSLNCSVEKQTDCGLFKCSLSAWPYNLHVKMTEQFGGATQIAIGICNELEGVSFHELYQSLKQVAAKLANDIQECK